MFIQVAGLQYEGTVEELIDLSKGCKNVRHLLAADKSWRIELNTTSNVLEAVVDEVDDDPDS